MHEHENNKLKFVLRKLTTDEDYNNWELVVEKLEARGMSVGMAEGAVIIISNNQHPIDDMNYAKALVLPYMNTTIGVSSHNADNADNADLDLKSEVEQQQEAELAKEGLGEEEFKGSSNG